MAERPQTLTVSCAFCSWTHEHHAPSERAALGAGRQLREQLLAHVRQEHADKTAGPPPEGAPPPPPPLPPNVAEDLAEQLYVCHEALRRIGTQNTLTAAKKIAAAALEGIAPKRAWNRSTR